MFWTALAAPVAVVVVGILLSREGDQSAGPEAPAEAAARPCDPLRLESCSATAACVAGRCRELRPEPRCAAAAADDAGDDSGAGAGAGAGATCTAARCAPGLERVHGRCLPPARVPLAPRRCREPASTEATIRELQGRCAAHLGEPGAPLTGCSAEFWETELREHKALEHGLHRLPDALSLHFPSAQPVQAPPAPGEAATGRPRGRGASAWPPPAVTAHYRQGLEGAEKASQALAAARAIVVVGRASAGTGDREVNRRLAGNRAAWAASLVAEVLTAADAKVPIIEVGLASDFALSPADFQGLVVGRPHPDHPNHPEHPDAAAPRRALVAWDLETEAWLRQDVARYAAGATDRESWGSLSATLNQVAWVLPLPCDGREFYPEPSFPKDSGHE